MESGPKPGRLARYWRFETGLAITFVGIWLIPNGGIQTAILVLWALWPYYQQRDRDQREKLTFPWHRSSPLWPAFLWLGYLLSVTLARAPHPDTYLAQWWLPLHALNALALLGFMEMIRQTCLLGNGQRLAKQFVFIGACTMVLSFPIFYWWKSGNPFPSSRLMDVFVHGSGLHPVLTGILSAAGATLGGSLFATNQAKSSWRFVWLPATITLVIACFFTYSRGALVGLGGGLLALIFLAPTRRTLLVIGCVVTTLLCCQWLVPKLNAPPIARPNAEITRRLENPAKELVQRGSNGRLPLYRLLWASLDSWDKHAFGMGLSGKRSAKPPEQHWNAPHPHSLYLATYLAGGAIGLVALLLILGRGAWQAWRNRHEADAVLWGSLLGVGLAALICDADVPAAFFSITRVEPLLIWLPWSAISTLSSHRREEPGAR